MSEQRTITRDTRLAAALGTLGVPIEIRKSTDARTGRQLYLYQLELMSMDKRHNTRVLKHEIRSGKLEARDPSHEALTALRAMQNRERLVDFQKKGVFLHLAPVPGTCLWQYVGGDTGLPGQKGAKELIETSDMKLVCALALVGVPLLAMDGGAGSHRYFLPRYGMQRPDGKPPADAVRLMQAWRANREVMPPDCPFAQGMWGLINRERLVNALNAEIESILLRKPRSMKSAIVRADAADAAFDKVEEHFDKVD